MDDRVTECLNDVLAQVRELQLFTDGMTFEQYQVDRKTQAAVERKFEIIGEALNRVRAVDQSALAGIRDCRGIISFRNILAHGYDEIDARLVWGVIENDVSNLKEDIERLLAFS